MSAHLYAERPVRLGVRQLDDTPSTEPVQREEGGVEPEASEATPHPGIEVTPLDGSPAVPGGDLEDGSLGLDVVVAHGPRQVFKSSDWAKQRIFRWS